MAFNLKALTSARALLRDGKTLDAGKKILEAAKKDPSIVNKLSSVERISLNAAKKAERASENAISRNMGKINSIIDKKFSNYRKNAENFSKNMLSTARNDIKNAKTGNHRIAAGRKFNHAVRTDYRTTEKLTQTERMYSHQAKEFDRWGAKAEKAKKAGNTAEYNRCIAQQNKIEQRITRLEKQIEGPNGPKSRKARLQNGEAVTGEPMLGGKVNGLKNGDKGKSWQTFWKTSKPYFDKTLYHGKNALKGTAKFMATHPLEAFFVYEFMQAQSNGLSLLQQAQYEIAGGKKDSNGHVYSIGGLSPTLARMLNGYDEQADAKAIADHTYEEPTLLNAIAQASLTPEQRQWLSAKFHGGVDTAGNAAGTMVDDGTELVHNVADMANTALGKGNDKLKEGFSYGDEESELNYDGVKASIDPSTGQPPSLGNTFKHNPINSGETVAALIMSMASKGMLPRLVGMGLGAYSAGNLARSYQQSQQRAAAYAQSNSPTPSNTPSTNENKVSSGLSM